MDATNKILYKEESFKIIGLYESASFIRSRVFGGSL